MVIRISRGMQHSRCWNTNCRYCCKFFFISDAWGGKSWSSSWNKNTEKPKAWDEGFHYYLSLKR